MSSNEYEDESDSSSSEAQDASTNRSKGSRKYRDRSSETEDREADDTDSQTAQQQVDNFRDAAEEAVSGGEQDGTSGGSSEDEEQEADASEQGQGTGSTTRSSSGSGSGATAAGGGRSATGGGGTADAGSGESGSSDSRFDQSIFVEGAQSDRGTGTETDAFPADPSEDSRTGGLPGYDSDSVTESYELTQDAEGAGFTAQHMAIKRVDSEEMDGDQVFVTRYSDDDLINGDLLVNQAATFAAKESLGANGPRMAFERGEDGVVRSVSEDVGSANGTDTRTIRSMNAADDTDVEIAQKVDSEEVIQQAALHLALGDWDGKPENVRLGDDGTVYMVDYDRTDRSWNDVASVQHQASNARDTINRVGRIAGNDELKEISDADVTDRAVEMAAKIRDNNDLDALEENIDAYVSSIDEMTSHEDANVNSVNRPSDGLSRASDIRQNIELLADQHQDS